MDAFSLVSELKTTALPQLLSRAGMSRTSLELIDALPSAVRMRAPPSLKVQELEAIARFVSKLERRELLFHPSRCGPGAGGGCGAASGGAGEDSSAEADAAAKETGVCDATLRVLAFVEAGNCAAAWQSLRGAPMQLDAPLAAATLALSDPLHLAWAPASLAAFLRSPAGVAAAAAVPQSEAPAHLGALLTTASA